MKPKHGKFNVSDLELVSGERVVLASGGPLMRVECVEGDKAVCAWDEWEGDWRNGNGVKKTYRELLAIAGLRKLEPVTKEQVEAMVGK